MQTSFENMAFTLHQIEVMKRLLSFINRAIRKIETSGIQNWTYYYKLKQASACYTENVYSGFNINNN